ncbi:MAG: hypothetical protein Q7T11_08845 [Deltaproteobacteria bacterium]|nr:hypothetical protein [Deltaproteobacteria bacterium]
MTFLSFVLLSLFSTAAIAGGPISVSPSGTAAKWDSPISLHLETGVCGSFSNADMADSLEVNLAYWEDITGISLGYDIDTDSITVDIDVNNYEDYVVETSSDPGLQDSLNPVIFDDTGEITDAIFGEDQYLSTLGFASADGYSDSALTMIADGQAVFNCRCLAGNGEGDCPYCAGNDCDCSENELGQCDDCTGDDCETVLFTTEDLDFTMTHELGHMTGLDHTQVNQALASGCDVDQAGDCDDLTTMYPISVDAADQVTPARDDEVAMLTLYGLSTLQNNFCTVTGTLLDGDGNPLRCADIQAETDDSADTIAVVSGIFASHDNNIEECLSDCGDFILRGLDPSKNYTITVKPISSQWTGGSGIFPCDPQLSGIEEQEIDSFSAGDCAGGATRALGDVETDSTGGVDDDDDDDDSSSASAGCSLRR